MQKEKINIHRDREFTSPDRRSFFVRVVGNDVFDRSVVVEADDIEQAISQTLKLFGQFTIEKFVRVTAKEK